MHHCLSVGKGLRRTVIIRVNSSCSVRAQTQKATLKLCKVGERLHRNHQLILLFPRLNRKRQRSVDKLAHWAALVVAVASETSAVQKRKPNSCVAPCQCDLPEKQYTECLQATSFFCFCFGSLCKQTLSAIIVFIL